MGLRDGFGYGRPTGRRQVLAGLVAIPLAWMGRRALGQQQEEPPKAEEPAKETQSLDGPGGQLERLTGQSVLREGTTLDRATGRFEATGARMVFVSQDETQKLVVLENLGLQRVGRALEDATGPLVWTVSGRITEYRGANYLLITHAVTHGQPSEEPDAIEPDRSDSTSASHFRQPSV